MFTGSTHPILAQLFEVSLWQIPPHFLNFTRTDPCYTSLFTFFIIDDIIVWSKTIYLVEYFLPKLWKTFSYLFWQHTCMICSVLKVLGILPLYTALTVGQWVPFLIQLSNFPSGLTAGIHPCWEQVYIHTASQCFKSSICSSSNNNDIKYYMFLCVMYQNISVTHLKFLFIIIIIKKILYNFYLYYTELLLFSW